MRRWRLRLGLRLPDTLLLRLLLAQGVTALALALVFAGLLYIDRNRTIGRLIAERWAPVLRHTLAQRTASAPAADGLPVGTVAPVPGPVWHGHTPPLVTVHDAQGGPRLLALRDTLRERGLPVQRIALGLRPGQPAVIWIALPDPAAPHGPGLWLSFADELVEPHLPLRLLLSLGLALLIVAAVSLTWARRLARPLDILRQRIAQHHPETPAHPPGPIPGATREIAAIDSAWQTLQARLAQHERERALLLAGISHDLRSPLARIRLAAELLPDTLDPSVTRRRDAILRNTDVADQLIGSFLDQVRSATLVLDETVDVAALAHQLVQDRHASGLGDVHLNAPCTPLCLPRAHPLLLERVLANLVDNAFKHGRPPVHLSVRAEGPAIVLEIEDAGPGLSPAQVPHVLQAFARGDASRGTPGTGLGLSVVAQVVRRLGGTLDFPPMPSGGCRVRVVLPIQVTSPPS